MTEFLQPYDYVERNATERPGDFATSDGEQSLSWSALRDLTKRIARELRDRGVGPGDVVGFRLPPYLNTVLALAVFHEAAVYAPFNLDMVDDAESEFALVLSNKPIDGWPLERTLIVSNSWFEKIHMNSTIIDQKRYPGDDGVLRHAVTGGTTKRSRVIRFGWVASAARATHQLALTPGAHQLMSLIGGRSEGGINQLFISLITGNPYLVPNEPTQNVTLISQFQVDVLRGSPHQLADLVRELERTGQRLPSVTTILPLGAALPSAVSEKLVALTDCTDIGNSYAATEVGSMCIRFTHSDDPNDMGEIRDGTEFEVVDPDTLEPVPDGVVGVVRARREHMAHEYYKDPEATAESFRDGWFFPGDLGVLNGRRFTLHGRQSEIINAGGSKIDPATVDEACVSLQGIEDCAAFGLVDASGATVVALAYVSARELEPRVVQTLAREKLGHRAPVVYVRVAEIPRTETGKVARNALSARFSATGTANPGAVRDDAVERVAPEGFVQPFEFVKLGWQADPDAPAVIATDFALSRAQLHFGAKQFAALLRERGVAPGDVVAIDITGPLQYQLTFAILHEAAVVTSFLPMMLAEGSTDVTWIVSNRHYNTWPAERQIVVDSVLAESLGNYPQDLSPRVFPSEESTMRLAFSSGTTGRPKAIPFSIFSATERARIHDANDFSDSQMLSLMPARLGMGWHWLYASAIFQKTFLAPGTPEENVRLARDHGVDSIIGSPIQLSEFCDEVERSGIELPALRVASSSGSSLPEQLAHRIRAVTGAEVIVTFGSTEVGHIAKRDNGDTDPSYLGDVMSDVAQVEIVDPETHVLLADGEVGLMRTRGNSMVSGYGTADDADSFRDGWFYSGDLGYLRGNALYLSGRVSELINVGGAKVDPTAIDAYFTRLGVFDDVAAFPLADNSGIDRVAIAYMSSGTVDVATVLQNARKALSTFTPTHAYRVDRIPRNESGKIMRKNLTEWVARRFGDDRGENR